MVRIGAVSYLNTRPLVHGLGEEPGAAAIELSFDTPAILARRMRDGELDVALLPVIELARLPGLEVVPGLGITTHGPTRSVLLVGSAPPESARRVALDPESRTSNALVRVLFDRVWRREPELIEGEASLAATLERADTAVRIGDKALFEPAPTGAHVADLGEVWTEATGLPFVFAAWCARPGVVDQPLYRRLHAARRRGRQAVGTIAESFAWRDHRDPALARDYLERHIRFRLGSAELRAMRLFFDAAASIGEIEAAPEIRLALQRRTRCDEVADEMRAARGVP